MRIRPGLSIGQFTNLYEFYRKTEEVKEKGSGSVDDMLTMLKEHMVDAFGTLDSPPGMILHMILSDGCRSTAAALSSIDAYSSGKAGKRLSSDGRECAGEIYEFLTGYRFRAKERALYAELAGSIK